MVWVFVAAGLLLLFTPPRIRTIGFALLGTLLLGFLVVVLVNRRPASESSAMLPSRTTAADAASRRFDFEKYRQEKKDRDDPDAASRIALTEIRFDQVQLIPGLEEGTIRAVQARLYNDSKKFTLTDYSYYLIVQDCLPGTALKQALNCTTVYDQRDSLTFAVPPGQARDVSIPLTKDLKDGKDSKPSILPFKLLGTPRIELTPTATRAYRTAEATDG